MEQQAADLAVRLKVANSEWPLSEVPKFVLWEGGGRGGEGRGREVGGTVGGGWGENWYEGLRLDGGGDYSLGLLQKYLRQILGRTK